jgi:hypothetical protein
MAYWIFFASFFSFICSPVIASGIRSFKYNAALLRTISALLMLPAFIASLLICKTTFFDAGIFNFFILIKTLPVNIGVSFYQENTFIIIVIITASILTVFFSNEENMQFHGAFPLSMNIFLLIAFCSIDLFLSASILMFGYVILQIMISAKYSFRTSINRRQFIWHLFIDLCVISLLVIYQATEGSTYIWTAFKIDNSRSDFFLLILALLLSVKIALASYQLMRKQQTDLALYDFDFLNIYSMISALIIITQLQIVSLNYKLFTLIILVLAVFLIVFSLYVLFLEKNSSRNKQRIFILLFSLSLLLISFNLTLLASLILAVAILFFFAAMSIFYLSGSTYYSYMYWPKTAALKKDTNNSQEAAQLPKPKNLFFLLLKHSAELINPIYANILLFRLPQLMLALLILPLKLFHNGNMQRSLLFALFISMLYFSLRGL